MKDQSLPRDPRVRLRATSEVGGTVWDDDWFWQLRGAGDPRADVGLELFQAVRRDAGGPPALVARIGMQYVSNGEFATTWGPARFEVCLTDLIAWRTPAWPYPWGDFAGHIACPAPNTIVWDQVVANRSATLQPLDLYCCFEPIGGERPSLVRADDVLIAALPDAYIVLAGRGFAPRGDRLHKAHAHYKNLPMTFAITVDRRTSQVERARKAALLEVGDHAERVRAHFRALPDPPEARHARVWVTLADGLRAAQVPLGGRPVAVPSRSRTGRVSAEGCLTAAVGLARLGRMDAAFEQVQAVLERQDPGTGLIPAWWGALPAETSAQALRPLLVWLLLEIDLPADRLAPLFPRLVGWLEGWEAARAVPDTGLCHWLDAIESGRPYAPQWGQIDRSETLVSVDLNAMLAVEAQCLARIAERLSRSEDAARWSELAHKRMTALRKHLWDAERGFFYDADTTGRRLPVRYAGALWPLLTGLLTEAETEALAGALESPMGFGTAQPVPTLAADEPAFTGGPDRGAVEPLTNFALIRGLETAGRTDLAAWLQNETLRLLDASCLRHGALAAWYEAPDAAAAAAALPEGTDWLGANALALTLIARPRPDSD